ncbi:MAG: hypothetical protein IJ518_06485 [Clostridia bacterium]|nr:hypothetical protein [Clostridia bacterium]
MKRFLSLFTVCTLLMGCLLLAGCGEKQTDTEKTFDAVPTTGTLNISSPVVVGESEQLTLTAGDGTVSVANKQNGTAWNATLTEAVYPVSELTKIWQGTVQSLIKISYSKSSASVQILSTTPVQAGAKCTAYRIENGVKFVYDFTALQIELALCLWVEGNQLVCRIPQAEVREYGTAILTSVEVMQFFGSAADTDEGYFFYPDGSGALMEFQKMPEKKLATKSYSWLVYGSSSEYLANTDYTMAENGNFFLPVFGAQVNGSGFAAVITEGDTDAKINLYTSALAVKRNRICCEFIYRRTYDVYVTNLDGDGESRSKFTDIDDEIIAADRELRYLLLDGEGSYSDMAVAIREYMLKTGALVDRITAADQVPLGLDLFIGTMTQALISDYQSMTTFAEGGEILQLLADRGVKAFDVTLEGWNKDGYGQWPADYRVNGQAGGKTGLHALTGLAQSLGARVWLNMNYVDVAADGSRFSIKRDIIRNRSNSPVTDLIDSRYLLTAASAHKWFAADSKRLPAGVAGVAFEGFGSTLYNDYQGNNLTERGDMAASWSDLLATANETVGASAVYGGNAYLLNRASRLHGIPMTDSGFSVSDRSVPFYQMVVHGSVAYSTEPANLFYDYDAQVLKLIEYGYMPYFKLTYERSEGLKSTTSNTLFSSYYAAYLDKAEALYTVLSGDLGQVWDAYMTAHEALGETLFCTTYSNGVRVYVNYSSEAVEVDGITIPALGYVVQEGGKA